MTTEVTNEVEQNDGGMQYFAEALLAGIREKNLAQKFDRPDCWTGVAIKYAAAGVAAWATAKACDYALEKAQNSARNA